MTIKTQRSWGPKHTLMILSILFGYTGIDRFYNQDIGLGIVKMLTLGGIGVWWIVDCINFSIKAGKE